MKPKIEIFKISDFESFEQCCTCMGDKDDIVNIANQILSERLGPAVFNHKVNQHLSDDWTESEYDDATHRAYLIGIEEIK